MHMRRSVVALAVASLTALVACGDAKSGDNALNSDSTLGRDLAMAAADTSAQPKLQDVPVVAPLAEAPPVEVAPKPTALPPKSRPTTPSAPPKSPTPSLPVPSPATTPAPTPVPAAPAFGVIDAGSSLVFATNTKVCSNTAAVGDKFSAPLTQAVSGSNGVEIPAGALGTFEVTESKTAKNNTDATVLKVRLVSVAFGGESYPVESTVQTATIERVRSASRGTDAKKVAGGAVIGAIAGQIIGKGTKGTVIGAAAGAAAGTAAASATADFDSCLNSGVTVTVKLDGAVRIARK